MISSRSAIDQTLADLTPQIATATRAVSGFNFAEHAAFPPQHWWISGRRRVILHVLSEALPEGSSLLDVGCGAGLLSEQLAKRYRIDSVDTSAEAVSLARERGVPARVVSPHESFPTGFDAACAFDVMEHVDDDLDLARRLAASVRPGGLVAVAVPAYRFLWSPMDEQIGHRRRYRRSGLRRVLAQAGLRPFYGTYFNSLLFPAVAAARLLGVGDGGADVAMPPAPLNRVLAGVFGGEAVILRGLRFPAGVSLLVLARKPA